MRANSGPIWGEGEGDFKEQDFLQVGSTAFVFVKLGCSVFMNEQEMSRVISKKTYLNKDHNSAVQVMQVQC